MKQNRAIRQSPVVILLLGVIFMLGACESLGLPTPKLPTPKNRPQLVAQPDKVSAMLADSATRATKALERLAAIESERGPGVAAPNIGSAPPELLHVVSIRWNGPAEPISKAMAEQAGYRFMSVGRAPPNDLVVTVDVERATIIDVLRDIGLQLGTRADIRIDSNKRLVELHYAANDANSGESQFDLNF